MVRRLLGKFALGNVAYTGAFAARSEFLNSTTTATVGDATTSATTTSTNRASTNVGDYIMQGLKDPGSPATKNGTDSTTTLHKTVNSTMTVFKTTTAEKWQACQSSWLAWSEEFSKTLSPSVYTTTYSYHLNETYNITYGEGNVYTTMDGIPRAHGSFTPTSVDTFT